jgi:hypothetical protein
MLAGAPHVPPAKLTAWPLLSTAAQNDADAHDTELRAFAPSISLGVPQAVPLKATAFPSQSTATQNDSDAHDTEVSLLAPSISLGVPQAVPLKATAFPSQSTATQNDADGQDTELSGTVPSMSSALQVVPLKVRAFPAESTATQNEADGQDTDAKGEESTDVGGDQASEARATAGAITTMITADSATQAAYRRGYPKGNHRPAELCGQTPDVGSPGERRANILDLDIALIPYAVATPTVAKSVAFTLTEQAAKFT